MDVTRTGEPAYYFPVLRTKEIVEYMGDMNIPVTAAEVEEPNRHKDRVRTVFLQLLHHFCDLKKEDFSTQRTFPKNTDILDHPELYEDAFSEFKFFEKTRSLMETCFIADFGMRDFHIPTGKRFKAQLSAVINFSKFSNQKIGFYAEHESTMNQLLMEMNALVKENIELTTEEEKKKLTFSEQSQKLKDIEEEKKKLEKEVVEANRIQTSRRKESDLLKERVKEVQHSHTFAQINLEELQAEERNLLQKLVSSPERRKKELDTVKAAVEAERLEVAKREETISINKAKIANMKDAMKDIKAAKKLAIEVQEKTAEQQEITNEALLAEEQKKSHKARTADLTIQLEESKREFRRTEDQLAHFRKQSKLKMDAAKEAFDVAQGKLIEAEKEKMDAKVRVEACSAKVLALEKEIEEQQKTADREVVGLIRAYQETEAAVLQENENFLNLFETR